MRDRLGTTTVLNLGDNNRVIIAQTIYQVLHDSIFKAYGTGFARLDIIALKSRVYLRAFYQDIAGEIGPTDTPCLSPADLSTLAYRNLPEDTYPIRKKCRQ